MSIAENIAYSRADATRDEIVQAAELAGVYGYGSVVLQSGERSDADFADFRAKIQPATLFAFQTTDLLRKMLPASQGGAQNPAADLQKSS